MRSREPKMFRNCVGVYGCPKASQTDTGSGPAMLALVEHTCDLVKITYHFAQPCVDMASIEITGRPLRGITDWMYSGVCFSKTPMDGIDTTRVGMPVSQRILAASTA